MQKKRYHIVRTIQNQISKSSTEAKSIPLTHKCMIAHFPGLVQAFQCGVKLILWAQSSSRNEMMRTCKGFPHVNEMSTLEQLCYKERYNLEYYISVTHDT
jgi:hypothetical protein